MVKLTSTTSLNIIEALKDIFARHGIPETVVSDNGPQYSLLEFSQFSQKYNFQPITSSLDYPQSNGHVERGVQALQAVWRPTLGPLELSVDTTSIVWEEPGRAAYGQTAANRPATEGREVDSRVVLRERV